MKKLYLLLGLVFLLSISFVSAVVVTDNNNQVLTLSANTGGGGYVIVPNYNTTGPIVITRYTGMNADDWYLYSVSGGAKGSLLASNTSITATNVTLYYSLTKGTEYILYANAGGASYNRYLNTTCSLPYNGTNIEFRAGWHDGLGTQQPTSCFNFVKITTDSFTPVSAINDSTESTAVVKQVGSVSFSGGAPTTILSSSFNVYKNDTPLYGGYSFNIESNGVNTVFCELLIDGVSRANVTRTQQISQLGSVFIQTPVFLIDEGSHTQTLRCIRQSGVGLITVTNAVGIGHFLINQDLEFLPYNSSSFSTTITSGTAYSLIDSYNITIGNKTEVDESQNRTNHIVLETQITYRNNAATNTIGAYMSVNGVNCSSYPRYVSTGTTGSVSMDCIIQNVTNETTYTVNIYGNGINAVYSGYSVAKNFFLSSGEIVGGTGVITGYSFSGSSWNQIFNSSGGNLNHDVANALVKLSYSVLTTINTQVDFYVVVSDGSTFTTNTWSRDFVAGQTGVIIGHDILQNLPQDPNYNITLFARCGVGATCTIKGGSSLGYLTDVITTVLNGFNVSAYDYWDNSLINNFTVVDGGTWNTTTGSVFVFTENNPENLSISSSGYFNDFILNHNTSLDLNVSLKQSDIKFQAFEIISGVSVSNANFTINSTTLNVNESFYLKAGTYSVTVQAPSYFASIENFTVSALDNKTLNYSIGNTRINLTAYNYLSGGVVSNYTVQFNYLGNSYIQNFSTSSTYLVADLIQGDFNITFFKSGYLEEELTIDINETYFNYSLAVYGLQNVSVNFFDEETLDQVINVDFDILGSAFSGSFNTGVTNNYFLADLPEDIYQIRFTAFDYSARSYYVVIPITDSKFVNLSLFLLNDSNDAIFVRQIVGQDASPLTGSYLEIQRPYASMDNTSIIYRTMAIAIIDDSGDAVFSAIPNTQQYRFRILDEDLNLLNTLTPSFLIDTTGQIIADESLSTMIDYNTALDVVGNVYYQNSTKYFIFDYTSPAGISQACLRVENSTGYSSSYSTTCSSDLSGTIAIPINSNLSVSYTATGYVIINGQSYVVDVDTLDLQYIGEREALRYIGPFIYFISLILFAAMSFFRPLVGIFGAVAVTAAFSLQFLGLMWFSTGLIGGLMVLGIVIAYFVGKRS